MDESSRTNDHIQKAVNDYMSILFRIAFMYLANREDAEDVVQNVFLRYVEKWPSFVTPDHEKAWLIRVSINMCKNHKQTSWHRRTVELNEDLAYPSFLEDEQDVFHAVQQLPPPYRLAVFLFYYEGYSTREIARICGLAEPSVRSRLFRARQQLKVSLKEAFTYD